MSVAVRLVWVLVFAAMSPAWPCVCTANIAASKASRPWAIRAVIIPVSTSPDPAVAMPGFPVLLV